MARADTTAIPPLAGVKVVEISSWIMTPAAGAILSAYGADVIKIEPAGSADPMRRLNPEPGVLDSGFELANNRKRSMQLNLGTEGGRSIVHRLIADADIFLTNVRMDALERAGLAPETLLERYPQLIIAHATGYGIRGDESRRPAFDELAYWARAGIATALQTEGSPPVSLVGALGDLPSAVALVAGVSVALFQRERQGHGSIVDVSLYQCGLWANGAVLAGVLGGRPPREKRDRASAHSPLYTSYRCADGAWVQLAMIPPMRYWPTVCRVLGRADLLEDPRFATFEDFVQNSPAGIAQLEATISTMTRSELGAICDAHDLPWSPIFETDEILADAQARENNYIVSKSHRSGVTIDTIAPPFSLRGFTPLMEPAPELGQHTEEVLLELGYDWTRITQLNEAGVL